MTTFHHAQLDSSRIQRIITALRNAGSAGCTTMDLNQLCNSTRASSDVSEARSCGVAIDCEYMGLSDAGRKVYRYRLGTGQQSLL